MQNLKVTLPVIGTDKLADNAVTTSKLSDGAVTTGKLVDESVTWLKLVPEARKSNPNLLDNAYFIGGGSQQGGGQFPINQRGLTEYTAGGYTIDRWRANISSTSRLLLQPDGVVLSNTAANYAPLCQPFESAVVNLAGKTVTLSFLVSEVTCGSYEVFISNENTAGVAGKPIAVKHFTEAGLASITVDIPNSLPNKYINVFIAIDAPSAGGTAGDLKVAAAKLELGDHQTLACESAGGGGWKLNNLPNFTDELIRCQRYQRIIPIQTIISGHITESGTVFETPLPDGMRESNPTFLFDGATATIRTVDGYSSIATYTNPGIISKLYGSNTKMSFKIADGSVIGPNNAPATLVLYSSNILIDKNL